MAGLRESPIDLSLLLPDEDYDLGAMEEGVMIEIANVELSEDELERLLEENEELFSVPAVSVQPLFIGFIQRAAKLLRLALPFHSAPPSSKLEYALDIAEKLLSLAGSNNLGQLLSETRLHQSEAVSLLLDFSLRVWQGK